MVMSDMKHFYFLDCLFYNTFYLQAKSEIIIVNAPNSFMDHTFLIFGTLFSIQYSKQ